MNKKGLTFMGFAIAVITLGLVLILIWPKVEKIIDDSHASMFTSKSKDLINSIAKAYVEKPSTLYSNTVSGGVSLDFNEDYEYLVRVNTLGKVTAFKITNGNYRVEGSDASGIRVEEVGKSYKIVHEDKIKYKLNSKGQFEKIEK